METRYPIRKADGTEYQSYEEVKRKLDNEQVRKWLVANNYLWHGGIHISRVSAPQFGSDGGNRRACDPAPVYGGR